MDTLTNQRGRHALRRPGVEALHLYLRLMRLLHIDEKKVGSLLRGLQSVLSFARERGSLPLDLIGAHPGTQDHPGCIPYRESNAACNNPCEYPLTVLAATIQIHLYSFFQKSHYTCDRPGCSIWIKNFPDSLIERIFACRFLLLHVQESSGSGSSFKKARQSQ